MAEETVRRKITLQRRLQRTVFNWRTFRMVFSVFLFFFIWYILVQFKVWRFERIPNPIEAVRQFFFFATSGIYYRHMYYSLSRIFITFIAATLLGVPLGILMGWNKTINNFAFPIVEMLRPIPPIAWVPVAILVFASQNVSIIFVTFLASFFATVLNTMLGVDSIETNYYRAAKCLGATPRDILRHVVVPGAMPSIFAGLTLGVGLAWFSLVGAEMIAGEYGLGYMVYEGYTLVIFSQIIIGMFTIGFLGYASSALVRKVGSRLMAWRAAW